MHLRASPGDKELLRNHSGSQERAGSPNLPPPRVFPIPSGHILPQFLIFQCSFPRLNSPTSGLRGHAGVLTHLTASHSRLEKPRGFVKPFPAARKVRGFSRAEVSRGLEVGTAHPWGFIPGPGAYPSTYLAGGRDCEPWNPSGCSQQTQERRNRLGCCGLFVTGGGEDTEIPRDGGSCGHGKVPGNAVALQQHGQSCAGPGEGLGFAASSL